MMGSSSNLTAGALVMTNTVSSNPPEAALTAVSPPQQLVLTSSGGTNLDTNNSNSATSSLTISGGSISGATITLNSGSDFTNFNTVSAIAIVIPNGVTPNLSNLNTANFITGGTTLIYNGHEYHGQDAVNMINTLQHPVTVNTTP